MRSPSNLDLARSGVVAIVIALAAGAGIGGWALCSRDPSPARPSEFVAAPQVIEQDFEASEAIAGAIQASLRARFLEPLRRRDWNRLTQAFADDFEAMLPAAEGAQRGAGPLFVVTRRKLNAPEDARLEAAGFVDHLKTMTQDLAVLERAKLQTWESLASPGGEQARVRLHVTLGGERTDGTRAAIHLDLMAGVVREGPEAGGAYRLRRLAADSIERVEALSPPLREVTDATGFHFNTSESNQGLEQSLIDDRRLLTTGGLTVADWNGDGFPDAFASVAGKRSVLFQNDGRGGFVRFEHPIPAAESPAFALLLDLDGDGTEELTTSHVLRYEGSRAFFPIYRRDSAGAWQRSAAHELSADVGEGVREFNVQGITAADLDRDGDLDLFFSAYSTSLSHRQDYNRVDARDGARNLLFVNEGGLRFVEDARARGITGTQYTYVAQIFDVTGDGNLDVLCGNDFGLNRLFAGRGDGTFEDQPAHPIVRGSSFTMGVSVGDLDGEGRPSIYLSNMYSHAGNRLVGIAADLSPAALARLTAMANGNQLFEQQPGGAWQERGEDRGLNFAEWAWGSAMLDLDGDGARELFVTNGFMSNRDRKAPDY